MRPFLYVIAGTLTVILLLSACAMQQKLAEPAYAFPDAMAPTVRAEFAKACDKGKVLYQINCAKCHNVKKGKQELIPDFSPDQIKGYEIRVSNAQHEKNMPDELVTAEELALIATFLQYKGRSGVPVAKQSIGK